MTATNLEQAHALATRWIENKIQLGHAPFSPARFVPLTLVNRLIDEATLFLLAGCHDYVLYITGLDEDTFTAADGDSCARGQDWHVAPTMMVCGL